MVYGSLSLIAFLLFLKSYGVLAQCPGQLPAASNIPSTAYIQPVGQVCFPAVIQIPDNTPPPPSPSQDDDEDYLNLIYLLISALTGSNKGKCNSNSNSNNNGRNSNNQNNYPAPSSSPRNSPSSGYVDITSLYNGPCSYPSPCGCIDITSLINCPTPYPAPVPSSSPNPPNSNLNPITISIDTSGAGTGCICDACNSNPFTNLNLFPGIPSGNPSCGTNINAPVPSYIPDSYNAGNGCIYVPYPVPVPYNVPGYNFDNICYPDNEYGPQEINLYIKTECD